MADTFTREKRSEVMRRIKSFGTTPEIRVRKGLHHLGYRFRINKKELPGKPDMVFAKYRAIVLIHGCFWHQHIGCKSGRMPMSRREYWIPKLKRNIDRDRENIRALCELGWSVRVIWECEIDKDLSGVIKSLDAWLKSLQTDT
jgi:DNA mismatch endonuclease, patch repair protein